MAVHSDGIDDTSPGTILESDEEIRKAQDLVRQQQKPSSEAASQSFRPTIRPPTMLLTICDDGRSTGEEIRIRDEQFIVGRTEGDFRLASDELLSSRHFAITRQHIKGIWRWVITDLQSKNGVFFRVKKAPLSNNVEFLVGSGCYRYQLGQSAGPETAVWEGGAGKTRALEAGAKPGVAHLHEVVRGGEGERLALTKDQYTIGSGISNDIVRQDDPFAAELHARLNRSEKGTWVLENNRARNGVWIRLPQFGISIKERCEFQAGEQRFSLSFGGKR